MPIKFSWKKKRSSSSADTHASHETKQEPPAEKHCLNCGAVLTGKYCSECGQRDQELHESIWHLIGHFAGDFFHFDSKFFRTLAPLLIKPGFLTNEHAKGKRANYMKPVQLYIFISVIFFLIYFSFVNDKLMKATSLNQDPAAMISDTSLRKDSALIQKLRMLKPAAAERIIDSLNLITVKNQVKNALNDSGDHSSPRISVGPKSDDDFDIGWTIDKNMPASAEAYKDSIDKLPRDKRPGIFERAITLKAIDINNRRKEEGSASLLQALEENFTHNIPKLMFLLLPFFAMILKLLYVRKKIYLVDHAIFTLHFHSFIFLLLLLVMMVSLTTGFAIGLGYIFLLISIYFVIALKKVYKQSWVASFFKAFFTYFLYSLVLTFVVIIGLVVSAATL
ncbi:MAG: DUF3667 domain-containing protein [Chitinophagales bacterium]